MNHFIRISLGATFLLFVAGDGRLFAAPRTTGGVSASARVPLATVQTLLGAASVRPAGARVTTSLRVRRALYVGDVVVTGPSTKLTLLFGDGAQVRLRENTAVEIASRTSGGKVNLLRVLGGEIWARLRPGNTIGTRTSALGVLGTEIRLAASDDASTLTVLEGAVDFHNDFGGVVVETNQQSVARAGMAPTKPVVVENAGFAVEWSFDLDRAVLPREQFYVSLNRATIEAELAKRRARALQNPSDAAAKRDLGDALFDAHEFDAALVQYQGAKTLSQTQTQRDELEARRGNALLELERPQEARAAFALALGQTGQNAHIESASLQANPQEASPLQASQSDAHSPAQDDARAGMAWLELMNNRARAAQTWAQGAPKSANGLVLAQNVALSTGAASSSDAAQTEGENVSPELLLARGVSALRSGQNEQAQRSLRALAASPSRWRYQGLAWLALSQLERGDQNALATAQKAVDLEPQSGLARGHLAMAFFFNNRLLEAGTQARRAVELNPGSVAARVTLGEVALARGEAEQAEREAARAVALDPMLAQAHYLLGIAQASRRDYGHARRSLAKSLDLAPDFLPSASALAHVYVATGQSKEGLALLTGLLPRYPQSDEVLAALGSVSYEGASYTQAEDYFRQATQKKPASALYQAELSRTLLFNNRLSEAIVAGEAAVHLAPQLGQPRAILGMAYESSGLRVQAERAYREALVRDPTNSLALARLGDFADTRPGAARRLAVGSVAQAFVFDPMLSRQLLRGGINTEISPSTGTGGARGLGVTHRLSAADGKFNGIGFFNTRGSSGTGPNADSKGRDASVYFTYAPDSSSNFYAAVRGVSGKNGLFGSDLNPSFDDRLKFNYTQAQFALRHQTSSRSELWLGLFGNRAGTLTTNPDLDSFIDAPSGLPTARQNFVSHALSPEARFDLRLGEKSRGQRLSFGLALTETSFHLRRDLQFPITGLANRVAGQSDRVAMGYVQLSARPGARWQLASQLRLQSLNRTGQSSLILPLQNTLSGHSSNNTTLLLPSLVASYASNPKTTLRLSLNRQTTDATTATFAPVDTLTSTETSALPFGTPNTLSVAQFDVERTLGEHGFLKAFAFTSRADHTSIGGADLLGLGVGLASANAPVLDVAGWRSRGLGVRLEQRVGSNFYTNMSLVSRQTSNRSVGALFGGARAPYEPSLLASLGLNYVDARGFKAGLQLRHSGAFFADAPGQTLRERFSGKTVFDLRLAREASARGELFLQVRNVFDTPQLAFSGYRIGRRQFEVGFNNRF